MHNKDIISGQITINNAARKDINNILNKMPQTPSYSCYKYCLKQEFILRDLSSYNKREVVWTPSINGITLAMREQEVKDILKKKELLYLYIFNHDPRSYYILKNINTQKTLINNYDLFAKINLPDPEPEKPKEMSFYQGNEITFDEKNKTIYFIFLQDYILNVKPEVVAWLKNINSMQKSQGFEVKYSNPELFQDLFINKQQENYQISAQH